LLKQLQRFIWNLSPVAHESWMKLIGMVISPLHCATPFCFQDKNEPPKPPSRVRNEVLVGKTAGKPGFQSIIDNIEKNSFPS